MSRPRIPTTSAGALERMRLILLVPAVLGAAITALSILTARGLEPLPRVAGAIAAVLLALHWVRGYRRGGFASPATDVPEAILLLVALLAAPGIPPLPLFGLTFRALYGGLPRSALRGAAWLAVLWATALIRDRFDLLDQVGKAAGLMLGVGLMYVLVTTFRRLDRAESRMRAVIEQSTDVVAIVGTDLSIGWAGNSIRTASGSLPALVEGTSLLDLVEAGDALLIGEHAAAAAAGAAEGTPFVVRMRNLHGEWRDVEAVIRNRLHDEHIEGLLLTLRDVTERRRLEREREELQRLRERVEADRERQRLEALVQRSQRLVSVGQLAGGVAHDFNNLLAAILNYAAMLREDIDAGSAAQEDLAEIEDAARRGARLVKQLLHFSKGELTSATPLNPNEVVTALRSMLHHSMGRHVRLRCELDPACAAITVDVTHAEQVVVNLVLNARDALETTGGTVIVTTANVELSAAEAAERKLEPGSYVRLSVADDGGGMDEQTAARALEPFFTTKEAGVGTGLGLATVAGIVSQAHGWVAIESIPGAGTTVSVHLPAAAAPIAAP